MKARLLFLAALLTGCSAGSDPATAPRPAGPGTAAPVATSAPSATPAARVLDVVVAGGKVSGVESRVAVRLGERLVLRVTSDVAEQIHVHGYDLYADLVPGTAAELAFTADLPGAYEVELHQARRPLFQLRVA